MTDTLAKPEAQVFLAGDPSPLITPLTVEGVAALLYEVAETKASWMRIPLTDGRSDALLRPDRIAALVPFPEDDE